MESNTPLVAVVAMSRPQRAIGNNNQLLWHIPDDLKRFKALTLGHPIIMGKKTFESIINLLGTPLPGRTNIVLTRDRNYQGEGAKVAHSLEEALATANEEAPSEIHIGGGAELYRQALPLLTKLYVTWVNDDPAADTFFPPFEDVFTAKNTSGERTHQGLTYEWVDYERKSS